MTWIERLGHELSARGVIDRERSRIIVELRDHIACEPGCEGRLGDPAELAARFANELATDEARRSAFWAFGALAVAAAALLASQVALPHGYPGFTKGLSLVLFIPALLGITIAPQVALVAGTLATVRALRRRRASVVPAAEIALIRRRACVGLGAGFATVVGLELYVVDFSSVLPGWWLAIVAGTAGLAGVALVAASWRLARARSITSATSGPAGDVFDDLPAIRWAWLRHHPWLLGVIGSLGVALAMTLVAWHAERSLLEGLQRGVFEGLAAAAGFALLGRLIGLTRAGNPRAPR